MTESELQQRIKDLHSQGKMGAISISTLPKHKYFLERKAIIDATSFLPVEATISERAKYIILGLKDFRRCECGCGQITKSPFSAHLPGHQNKDPKVKQKKLDSVKEHYGIDVTNVSQLAEVKEKKKQTYKERYGADHYMSSEKGYAEYKQKMLEKTGVENPFQLESAKLKIREKWYLKKEILIKQISSTHKENFYKSFFEERLKDLVKPLFTVDEYIGVHHEYDFLCLKCNCKFKDNLDGGKIPRCKNCFPTSFELGFSQNETNLIKFLETLFDKNSLKVHNRKEIFPLELDVYIPEKKIAIEYDGLYWHSELNHTRDRDYHLRKTERCEKKGIRLIHIFEDEWILHPKIVKARLKHILGKVKRKIYARKCEIRQIPSKLRSMFLNKYHIQGADSGIIKLGAFYKNRLVAVMTFSKPRLAVGQVKTAETQWELCRFATIAHFNVVGIASKLLSYFEKNFDWTEIISFADKRWSQGGLYKKLGFSYDHDSRPNYWYTKDYLHRHHRFAFRKNQLAELFKENFDPNLPEWKNMENNGWARIWDCGNRVFLKIKN